MPEVSNTAPSLTEVMLTRSKFVAVLEWTIAFGFTFYLLTFIWDMRMAKGVQAGELRRERLLAVRQEGPGGEVMREASVAARKVMIRLVPEKPSSSVAGT